MQSPSSSEPKSDVPPAPGIEAEDTGSEGDFIAVQIQTARERANLSVVELGRLTGISKTVLHGYERGRTRPGAREIRAISNALKVSPNWLIFGNDSFETDRPTLTSIYRKMKARPGLGVMLASMYIPFVTPFLDEDELYSLLVMVEAIMSARHPEKSEQFLILMEEMSKYIDAATLPDGSLSMSQEEMQKQQATILQTAQARFDALKQARESKK
jgi:transcriptional regulator with XRE-family HTH domain